METLLKEQVKVIPIENRIENEIFIQKVLITPNIARKLIAKMVSNRNIKKRTIERIKYAISNNEWECENGETIKILSNGRLFDGHHRLQAIIDLDIDIPMYITFNCNTNSMATIDTGAIRSLSDVLKINNIKYYAQIGTVIKSESAFKSNKPTRHASHVLNMSYSKILKIAQSNQEYLEFVCKNAGSYNSKFSLLTTTEYAKFFNILYKIDKESCFLFFEMLSTGKNSFSSMYQLRQILIKDASKSIRKFSGIEKEALLIKSWNFYMNGNDTSILRWRPFKSSFPKIKRMEHINNWF